MSLTPGHRPVGIRTEEPMSRYVINRLLQTIPVLFGVSLLVFSMLHLVPGDPIMGFITDNTRSKWGRRKQYVMIGALLMGVAFIFMWQLYASDTLQYNFWYFFLWSVVFYLG